MDLMYVSNLVCLLLIIVILVVSFKVDRPSYFNVKHLSVMALLMSLSIVLGSYLKIKIPLFGAETFEIKFDSIPIILIGLRYGVFRGALSGFLVDMIQLLLSPTPFPYFGFTLNMVLYGTIGGVFSGSQLKTGVKLVIVAVLSELFVSYFLTVLWLNFMFKLPILVGVAVRLVRFVVMTVLDILILKAGYEVLKRY